MSTTKLKAEDLTEIRLRKRLKRIIQPHDPERLEVVIIEIWVVRRGDMWDVKFIVSFGGKKSITIHGTEDWKSFIDLIDEVDFLAETTQEMPVVQKEKGE